MTEPTVRVTRYEVSCLPPANNHAPYFTLWVHQRRDGRWIVTNGPSWLGSDGRWETGPLDRDDAWMATHTHDLDTALRLAKEAAPKVTVNGHTVADVLAKEAT